MKRIKNLVLACNVLALVGAVVLPRKSDAASGDEEAGTLACTGIGHACTNDSDCCSHHCKNFSAGFYCYRTNKGAR